MENKTQQQLMEELILANKELSFQLEEKKKRAAELIIANEEKEKRAIELIIANEEKEKRAIELDIAIKENEEKNILIKTINEEYETTNEELRQTNQHLIISKEKAEESDLLKSAFLANMSHEIRTPMNGILGFTDLLKSPNLTGEKQKEFIALIENSGNRMLNIINDIISISKIESGSAEIRISDSNVCELIEYIYHFFKTETELKGLELIFKNNVNANAAFLKTDKEKVFAILTNLVKNAIKFTLSGFIEIGVEKTEKEFLFFVKDTGVGINHEQKEFVFERFMQGSILLTRNYEGAGLGLSISKAYVEMIGGKIWLESELGKGTTFYFTIPCNTDTEEIKHIENNAIQNKEINKNNGIKILLAEDDETTVTLNRINLEHYCKNILIAKNGLEAVHMCRNNPDIDLILMDMKMPEMNGYDATIQIRQFNKEVIIIAQTAYALLGDKDKAIEIGCNDYISKPVLKTDLLALIQKYF